MGSIPLPALGIQPPQQQDMMGSLSKLMAIKSMQQEQQVRQQEMEQRDQMMQLQAQKVKEQKILTELYVKNNGDLDKTISDAAKSGVTPETLQALQLHSIDVKGKILDLVTKQGALAKQQSDLILGAHDTVASADEATRPQVYKQQLQGLQQAGIDVSQMPPEYPGAEGFKVMGAAVKVHAEQVAEAFKQREVAAQELTAQAHMQQAQRPQLPTETSLAVAASQGDPKAQAAQAELLRQHTAVAQAGAQASGALVARQQGRADKSYQFASSQLDKVGQPVEAAVQRLGRLQDTLSQNTPQADALVAPELLTVMAGGQGSGLRMNEAEIARIVGGRSKWQSLQASINKWKLDPTAARSITPEQQQQIRSLVSEVQKKLLAKQSALDDARQALINSDDPMEHRTIVANTRKKLTDIDTQSTGGGQSSGTIRARDPQGRLYEAPANTPLPTGWKAE